jgi:NRPS condensation-like uncharacterized protein
MTLIDKERTWVYAPVNSIVIKVDIKGVSHEDQLKEAIRATVNHYDMFHQKITVDQDGKAYYESTDTCEPVIKAMEKDWMQVAKEQERLPFRIDKGEFIRFFYDKTETGMTLLIIAHHIAGDGISFTYFIEDILRSLAGENIEYKKLELFNMNKLPRKARLRPPITWLIRYMNRQWKKSGKIFSFNDYYDMHQKYWQQKETAIYTYYLENEIYDIIYKYSKEHQLTINTLITTALIRASEELSDVGMAVSIRDKGFTGMGNYASGISVKYRYDEKKSFAENAGKVQKMIYDKLNNPSKKYFLLQFMRSIAPTLIDAIYFNACGDFNNKTAEMFSKMFGYKGNPKGISITNLTKLPIQLKHGDYELEDAVFIPPLVLNAKRIIGIAAIDRKIILSLHVNNDDEAEEHHKFFNKGMEYLKKLT